ncbi:MAG: IclR family transcriptional regulator [Ruegeria sp.]|uniref:IclR family transcriptional regulator n=1 Tax=Ruegeria sp. TaxID=1879320 RepID=UPI00349F003F
MKTVDKALSVLDQFSLENTEIGLSELSRMAGLDKAATRRLLVALAKHGFIEQAADTRKYRLGHGFLRLARIREATVPIVRAAQEVSNWLVEQANETAHVSIPGAQGMTTIAHRLPKRGNVINIIPSQILYYHATASGLAFLAFASSETANKLLKLKREKITDATVTSKPELQRLMVAFKRQGYSQTRNSFETDVASVAMPFFQDATDPAGCIALALPRNDLTDERRDELLPMLKDAISRMETALTGL